MKKSFSVHVFVYVATIAFSVTCSSGGDATGPGESPSVSLTASPTNLNTAGMITLVANARGGSVQKVEFYGRHIDVDTSVRLGEATSPPYQFQRQMEVNDNGHWEFVAKAHESDGATVTSNSVTTTVAITDTRPLAATFIQSKDRTTTPGRIDFTVWANKPLARIEVDRGDLKVVEVLKPPIPGVASITVTASDNGTASYVVKAVDTSGATVSSAPLPLTVDIRWDLIKKIADVPNDGGLLLARDVSGALYIAISTQTNDIALVKSDDAGRQLWIRTFGGPDMERAGSVAIDQSGRVYVIGAVGHPNQPTHPADCVLLVYDSEGTLLRTQLIPPPTGLLTSSCVGALDRSGNVYVATPISDESHANPDILLGKYDTNGATIWTQRFSSAPGTSNDDILTSIACDLLDDGVYVSGYTSGSFDGAPLRGFFRDLFVLKFDGNGNRLWSTQYGIAGLLTFGSGLAADPNGGVYVQGSTDAPDRFGPAGDALVLRVDAAGNVRWAKRLDSGGFDATTGIAADSKGTYVMGYVYGDTYGDTAHDFTEARPSTGSAFLAKISADGSTQFIRLLNSASLYSAVITPAGDVVAAGHVAGGAVAIARHHDPAP